MSAEGQERSPVYRSAAGREAVLAAYRAQAGRVPFPFESRFVPTAFGATHVVLAGPEPGPPLVVLSGVHFGAFFTSEWLGQLAPWMRLVVPDVVGQPNFSAETRPRPRGREYARWLADVLDALEIEGAAMLGISFGGGILLDFASLAPERIKKAALLVPAGFAGGSMLGVVRRLFLPWTIYGMRPRPSRIADVVAPLAEHLPEHWYAFFDLLLRHVHWAVRPPGPFDSEELARYRAPTLAIFAEEDCFFPGRKAARAAARVLARRATTEVVPGKHIPTARELERIERELLGFFERA